MTTEAVRPPAPPAVAAGSGFPLWARRVFQANLVAQIVIVVSGGVVRLTGSGLGCPTWPQCVPGSYTPVAHQEQAWHKYVEFTNRTLTFVLVVLSLAALAAAVVHVGQQRSSGRPVRRPVVALALVPLLGTPAQAVLGGITVLTGLNPVAVGAHFLLSMSIIAGCVNLVVRSAEPADLPFALVVRQEIRWTAWTAVCFAALVVVIGTVVTGSGPHAGDAGVQRYPFDPRTVSWLHADTVMLYLGLLAALALALRLTGAPSRTRRAVALAIVIALSQGVVGYTQYFTGLPWAVVAVHVLGASLVWAATVYLLLTTRSRGMTPSVEPH